MIGALGGSGRRSWCIFWYMADAIPSCSPLPLMVGLGCAGFLSLVSFLGPENKEYFLASTCQVTPSPSPVLPCGISQRATQRRVPTRQLAQISTGDNKTLENMVQRVNQRGKQRREAKRVPAWLTVEVVFLELCSWRVRCLRMLLLLAGRDERRRAYVIWPSYVAKSHLQPQDVPDTDTKLKSK